MMILFITLQKQCDVEINNCKQNYVCNDNQKCIRIENYPLYNQDCNNVPDLCGQLICYQNKCVSCREQSLKQDNKFVCYQGKYQYNLVNRYLKLGCLIVMFILLIVPVAQLIHLRKLKIQQYKVKSSRCQCIQKKIWREIVTQ